MVSVCFGGKVNLGASSGDEKEADFHRNEAKQTIQVNFDFDVDKRCFGEGRIFRQRTGSRRRPENQTIH